MVELADIFRLFGSKYRAKFGNRMLTSHKKAMRDIEQCRTPALGGSIYACPECRDQFEYSYHSCKNRACPKCQNEETTQWVKKQTGHLLPVDYFMVTYTLPEECRKVARSNQKDVYNAFFRASAGTFMELAKRKKHLGGKSGMLGVLQTWARNMAYHVHIHYIVPGGALSHDGTRWLPHRYKDWLVPVRALSRRFKNRFKRELERLELLDQVDTRVWNKDWNVHCEPVGSGSEVLKYIAPYVYRIAISNNRIESLDNDKVTFRFKDNKDQWQHGTLDAEEFIRRFLQHVLPKGFVKIRCYGFLAAKNRKEAIPKIRNLLECESPELLPCVPETSDHAGTREKEHHCPKCSRVMVLVQRFSRNMHFQRAPPNTMVP